MTRLPHHLCMALGLLIAAASHFATSPDADGPRPSAHLSCPVPAPDVAPPLPLPDRPPQPQPTGATEQPGFRHVYRSSNTACLSRAHAAGGLHPVPLSVLPHQLDLIGHQNQPGEAPVPLVVRRLAGLPISAPRT